MYTHTHCWFFCSHQAWRVSSHVRSPSLHRLCCPCEKTMGPPESLVSLLYTFSKSFLWTTNFNMASALTLLYTPHVGCCEPHGRSCSYTICAQRKEAERCMLSVMRDLEGSSFVYFFFFFPPTSFPFLVDSLSPAEKVAVGVLSSRWLAKGHPRLVSLFKKGKLVFIVLVAIFFSF